MYHLDKLDRAILNELQTDATIPLKELADRVNSTLATCQRRIQLLKQHHVITKQVAIVSPSAVGKSISVFVLVELDNQQSHYQAEFERKMRGEKDVIACYEISGDYDYLLLVHTEDMTSYHRFIHQVLIGGAHVKGYKSQFVMNFFKAESKIIL